MKKVLIFLLFALGVQVASAQVQQVPKEFEGLWICKAVAYEHESGNWAPPRTFYLKIQNLPDGISVRGKIEADAYVCKTAQHRGKCADKEVLYSEFEHVYFKDGYLHGSNGTPIKMHISKGALIVEDLVKIYAPYGFFGTFYNANDNW